MKAEIDTAEKLRTWLTTPTPAVFQGQDLTPHTSALISAPLKDCVFLGCRMDDALAKAAASAGCFIIPPRPELPFNPFSPGLYSPDELFDAVNGGDVDYKKCLDYKIYSSYADPVTRAELAVDVDIVLMRRIHDASIQEALSDVLDEKTMLRSVAIMGGHDIRRNTAEFERVARLALKLTQAKYLVVTGGGPGAMEAANLGAYVAGFADPDKTLRSALVALSAAPLYKDPNWLTVGYRAWKAMGAPQSPTLSQSIGIPTWFYGHEPPNVFATHIAKYFENSVREEGLLAVALGGVIFTPGNGGTVQEIFQDACQNYYRTYAKKKSPMILFGSDYWAPQDTVRHIPQDNRKPAYALLEKLATEKAFNDYLAVLDDPDAVVDFLSKHPPI